MGGWVGGTYRLRPPSRGMVLVTTTNWRLVEDKWVGGWVGGTYRLRPPSRGMVLVTTTNWRLAQSCTRCWPPLEKLFVFERER